MVYPRNKRRLFGPEAAASVKMRKSGYPTGTSYRPAMYGAEIHRPPSGGIEFAFFQEGGVSIGPRLVAEGADHAPAHFAIYAGLCEGKADGDTPALLLSRHPEEGPVDSAVHSARRPCWGIRPWAPPYRPAVAAIPRGH